MSSTKFSMTRDVNGYNGFGIMFSEDGQATSLAANAEQHFVIPSNYPNWIAIFSYTPGSNIWVDGITTAAVPSTSFDATTAELNPAARAVSAGQTLSFITADTTTPWVSVKLLVVNPYVN
jgi:hypothetical protein